MQIFLSSPEVCRILPLVKVTEQSAYPKRLDPAPQLSSDNSQSLSLALAVMILEYWKCFFPLTRAGPSEWKT